MTLHLWFSFQKGKERRLSISSVVDSDQGEYSFQSTDEENDQAQVTAITATLELTGGKVKVEKKKTKGENT